MNIDPKHMLNQVIGLERAVAALDEQLTAHRCTAKGGSDPRVAHVVVNGLGDVVELDVSDELAATADAGVIAAAIRDAFARALSQSREHRDAERRKLTGGLKLPDV